jgi:hypothetical protein
MRISLNQFEIDLAVKMATEFNNLFDGKRSYKQKSDRDPFELKQLGFEGEIAFSKMFNIYPRTQNEQVSNHKGTDKGDIWLPFVGKIDVKTHSYPYADLLIHKDLKINGDFYAHLRKIDNHVYEYCGLISQKRAHLEPPSLNPKFKSGTRVISVDDLFYLNPDNFLVQGCGKFASPS